MSDVAGPITSLTNPRVKAAVRLRDRREREASGLTIVDGGREVLRALEAGVAVESAFLAGELLRSADAIEAGRRLRRRPGTVEATPAVLAKVAFGDRSDGVVAIVRTPNVVLGDLEVRERPLLVVVEGVEKPGNLGAVLRSADGAGADAVIVADPLTDPFNPNAIRASLGTIFSLPVVVASSTEALDWLTDRKIRPVAALVEAGMLYTMADLRGPLALVLGSEAHGLSSTWHDPRVETVRIPMAGFADSLNVSIASAILLYEAVRQRGALADTAH